MFNGWTEHAYNETIEQTYSLQNIQRKNHTLHNRRETLLEAYDKLTKDVLLSERKWDFLMRIQVAFLFVVPNNVVLTKKNICCLHI